jgi:hypothetical protein
MKEMPSIFENEYKQLRQFFILLINTWVDDLDIREKYLKKLHELDEKIDRRRQATFISRNWNKQRTNRTKFRKFTENEPPANLNFD